MTNPPPPHSLLRRIAEAHGTPCFVYFLDEVFSKIDIVRQMFGDRFLLSYAVKSNPNPTLLSSIKTHVSSLDISSGGELSRALKVGWDPSLMSFTGPGKTKDELISAVKHAIGDVVIESVHEAHELNVLAKRQGVVQPILLRIAPLRLPRGFGVRMGGKPTQFGIEEEELDYAVVQVRRLSNLSLRGFHIYSGTQCLSADAIAENYQIFCTIFRDVSFRHRLRPDKVIFGSGLGIPYHENDEPVDLVRLAERVNPMLDELRSHPMFADTRFVLETGRYFVGEAGIYLTRVIRTKHSRGVDICICDGGMNHHLAACGHMGSVIHRNFRMFKLGAAAEATHKYTLVGPLCTSIDTIGHGVELPHMEVGDIVGIRCSGAYGLTASPLHFISHDPPKEIMVKQCNGKDVWRDATYLTFEAGGAAWEAWEA